MWDLAMRGGDARTEALFPYLSCEAQVPKEHPLRPIRALVDQALSVLSPASTNLFTDRAAIDRAGEAAAGCSGPLL